MLTSKNMLKLCEHFSFTKASNEMKKLHICHKHMRDSVCIFRDVCCPGIDVVFGRSFLCTCSLLEYYVASIYSSLSRDPVARNPSNYLLLIERYLSMCVKPCINNILILDSPSPDLIKSIISSYFSKCIYIILVYLKKTDECVNNVVDSFFATFDSAVRDGVRAFQSRHFQGSLYPTPYSSIPLSEIDNILGYKFTSIFQLFPSVISNTFNVSISIIRCLYDM